MNNESKSNPIRDIVASRIDGITRMVIGEGVTTEHHPTRGAIREAALRNLIGQLLPLGTSARSGFIVSKNGHISKQLDLIIVADRLIPPLLLADDTAIVPIEAALGVVEVKTTIHPRDLTQIEEQVTGLAHHKLLADENVSIPFYLLGFGEKPSNAAKNWLDASHKRQVGETDPAFNLRQWIRGACIIREYSVTRDLGETEFSQGRIMTVNASSNSNAPEEPPSFNETLAFLAAITRETAQAEKNRRIFPDAIACYLSDEGNPYT